MKLTKTDKKIIESYQSVVEGLASYLGSGCEILLHSLEDYNHSAIKVMNGFHSGRTEGAPITDLAIKMLTQIQNQEDPHTNMIYLNKKNPNAPVRSATLPIIGENNRIIGLICINYYLDISLFDFVREMSHVNSEQPGAELSETYSRNSEDMILQTTETVQKDIYANPEIPNSLKNKEIILSLQKQGIFQLKDSVSLVAKTLNITKNTVYLHLRNHENQEK